MCFVLYMGKWALRVHGEYMRVQYLCNFVLMPLCCVFYESGVCFVMFAMFVQAEHVAEDPGWQVGNKNYINRKKQKLCAALFSSESVLKI